MGAPPAEVEIGAELVRSLLDEQHPDLAGLALRPLASGWDNVLYRLGDELVVRLPRRAMGAVLMEHELAWLPGLADGLPLPISVPVRSGKPSGEYPWTWAVVPWFPGATAEATPPADFDETAAALARFLVAFHRPAPADAPTSALRGIPLAERAPFLRHDLDELGGAVDQRAILRRWAGLLDAPAWPGPPLWLHGDVHPLNLIVHAGVLSAVVDFGDLCQGDPASDLAVAWMLFPPGPRAQFRSDLGADDGTWARARGWALALGVALANGDDRVRGLGHRTLAAVLADPAP